MGKYIVTCESTVDLSSEVLKEKGIPFISYIYTLDGKEYPDDFGESYPLGSFYEDIRNGAMPTTTQINARRYTEFFEPFLARGYDVLHIGMSSGLSGSLNSSVIAAKNLREKYDRKIYCVDSLNASGGYGLLTLLVKQNADEGMSFDDNLLFASKKALEINAWFFSADLSSYIRGGRISKAAGFVGSALKICPLLFIDPEGKLIVKEKIRTKTRCMKTMVEKMAESAENKTDYDGEVIINHSSCLEDALALKEMIYTSFPKVKSVDVYDVGTVIGTHTGPGTVGVFYLGKSRELL